MPYQIFNAQWRIWFVCSEHAHNHPGEVLREEFLIRLGLSAYALAQAIQVSAPRINDLVRERRAMTADTALRLSQYFGVSPEFWLGLQADYDVARTRPTLVDTLSRIVPLTMPQYV